ncbi:hypothetical protein PS6_007988 [Mucor atramentarius]
MNRVNCEQDFPLQKIQGQPPPPPLLQQLLLLQNKDEITEETYNPLQNTIGHFAFTYESDVVEFDFENDEEYLQCRKRLPPGALVNPEDMKHTTLLYCKHSGGKSDKSPFTITAQDGTIAKNNKKVDCKACIKIKVFNNDSSRVISNWKHQDHDPTSIADLSGSRLPQSAKKNGLMSMWKMEGNKAGDTQDHGDIEDTPNNGEEKEDEKEVGNIWESRKTLLKTIREKATSACTSNRPASVFFAGDAITLLPALLQEKMKASVAPLMMRIVTARGGDKPNHWVTIKFKRSIKLKWPESSN